MAHDAPLSEPKSPMWLPALGAALLVLAAAVWLVTPAFTRADVTPSVDAGPAAADAGEPDAPTTAAMPGMPAMPAGH